STGHGDAAFAVPLLRRRPAPHALHERMRPTLRPLPLVLAAALAASLAATPTAAQRPTGSATGSKMRPALAAKSEQTAQPAIPPVAAPQPRAEEQEHAARYDLAIAPVRDAVLSSTDAAHLREALAAAGAGRVGEAKSARDRIADAAARKLVDWSLHRAGASSATEIRAFLEANPSWPER